MTNLSEAHKKLELEMSQIKKGVITIFCNSMGLGKSTAMEKQVIKDFRVGTSSIIFSQQHEQLKKISRELKKIDSNIKVKILKGWYHICKHSKDKKIISLVKNYGCIEHICNIKCPHFKDKCKYHTQFKWQGCNITLSPLEFIDNSKLKKLPIKLYFDENPIKFEEQEYCPNTSTLIETLNPSLFEDYVSNEFYPDFTNKLMEFCSDIQTLIEDKIESNIKKEISAGGNSSYINQNRWIISQKNNFNRVALERSLSNIKGYLFRIFKRFSNSNLPEDKKIYDLQNILAVQQIYYQVNKLIKWTDPLFSTLR